MTREPRMAWTIVERPGSVNTISAAPTGSVRRALDSDTDIGTGQRRRIVRTVAGHRDQVSKALKTLNDLILMLGEDPSEAVRVEDHRVERRMLASWLGALLEHLRRVHVVTQSKTTSSLLCDCELVTSNHLDLDTEGHSVIDRLLGIRTRRVENGKQTNELEAVALSSMIISIQLLVRDSQSTETALRKLLDVGLETVLDLLGLVARAELDDDTGHTLCHALQAT